MNTRTLGATLVLGLTLAATQPALGQEYDDAAALAAYEKASTPSAAHAKLAELEGTWEMTVTMWMDPSADPLVSAATSSSKMVLGGRYLFDTVEGTAMGQPFSGMGWTGYDNIAGQYVSTWIDNFGTGIFTSQGDWDDEAGGLVMRGSYVDPVSGQEVKVKSVSRMDGPDKQIFTWYEKRTGDAEGRKTMEIVSVRQ